MLETPYSERFADITKLKGPAKWTCFHLYVILDIFSCLVVGWLIADREDAELAEQLIADTVARHDIEPGMLTLHADRGTSMRSKPVAALLVDLDIAKSHSRPYVSDDNPYSEAQFKTLKYQAEQLRTVRQVALDAAFRATPNRFKGRRPEPPALPTAAWINPPLSEIITPEINTDLRNKFMT